MLIENNFQSLTFFKNLYNSLLNYLTNLYQIPFLSSIFYNSQNGFLLFLNNCISPLFFFINSILKQFIYLFTSTFFSFQSGVAFRLVLEFDIKNTLNLFSGNFTTFNFDSLYFSPTDSKTQFLLSNEELGSSSARYHKFDNPIFKYDYKSGDYFPKLYKEVYTFLFSSMIDLTGGLRQAP